MGNESESIHELYQQMRRHRWVIGTFIYRRVVNAMYKVKGNVGHCYDVVEACGAEKNNVMKAIATARSASMLKATVDQEAGRTVAPSCAYLNSRGLEGLAKNVLVDTTDTTNLSTVLMTSVHDPSLHAWVGTSLRVHAELLNTMYTHAAQQEVSGFEKRGEVLLREGVVEADVPPSKGRQRPHVRDCVPPALRLLECCENERIPLDYSTLKLCSMVGVRARNAALCSNVMHYVKNHVCLTETAAGSAVESDDSDAVPKLFMDVNNCPVDYTVGDDKKTLKYCMLSRAAVVKVAFYNFSASIF
jgi:hypothetical protein